MCLSSSFVMSSSLAQLSSAFSVLLAAITHFTLAFFQRNKHSLRVTFAGQFLACLGKFPLGSKSISGGAAIRMSWCAFFQKINSRGGDVYSGLESIYVCVYAYKLLGIALLYSEYLSINSWHTMLCQVHAYRSQLHNLRYS